MHIIMNMAGLFFLGRYVEQLYGSKEFLRIYLVMIILGSLCFALGSVVTAANYPSGKYNFHLLRRISGGVWGVTILLCSYLPQ